MLRFFVGPVQNGHAVSLEGAYLVGTDGVPVRADLQIVDREIRCKPRNSDPTALSLLWHIPEVGSF
ncbi:MAG: hypothetical protein AB7N71_03160, partial [Phycisphaerae bacterium]